jgi:hypothetical protein
MDKTVTLLQGFIESYDLEHVCRLWVDDEADENGDYWVYMVLDKSWYLTTKPDFIVRRMKQGLKSEIRKYLGLDVEVGITFEDCGDADSINESISQNFKRRLLIYDFDEEIKNIFDYEINTYLYTNLGDFISDVCDILANNLIDSISDYTPTPKEKDELYYYFIEEFSNKIKQEYVKTLKNRANKSVKQIIVTETQYKRLFEEKKPKKEMFQELIDEKLEYIKNSCEKDIIPNDISFTSCEFVDMIESIKVVEVDTMTGARTDMEGNLYDTTPSIYIKVMINYSTIRNYYDFDDVIYDIKYGLKKSTGLPIVFHYRTNNLNQNKEW